MEDTRSRTLTASDTDPSSISAFADVMASPDAEVAKAAREAMCRAAHQSARPGSGGRRQAVAMELLRVAQSARPRAVRADALYLLGFVGGRECVKGLAELVPEKDIGEDARMALERIPGPEADKALSDALGRYPHTAPAIRQSLAARRLVMGKVGTPSR